MINDEGYLNDKRFYMRICVMLIILMVPVSQSYLNENVPLTMSSVHLTFRIAGWNSFRWTGVEMLKKQWILEISSPAIVKVSLKFGSFISWETILEH